MVCRSWVASQGLERCLAMAAALFQLIPPRSASPCHRCKSKAQKGWVTCPERAPDLDEAL